MIQSGWACGKTQFKKGEREIVKSMREHRTVKRKGAEGGREMIHCIVEWAVGY